MLTEREDTETMEVGGEGGDGVGMDVDSGKGEEGLTEKQKEVFSRHMEWLDGEENKNGTRRFMNAVRDLGVFDKLSAQVIIYLFIFHFPFLYLLIQLPPFQVLFSRLFPICWESLSPKQQEETVLPLMDLLATEYHMMQIGVSPNPIQTFLMALAECKTPPGFFSSLYLSFL